MPLGSEAGSVQRPFVRYAEEAGWKYLSPQDAANLRRGLTSPFLDSVLIDQLQRLNPGIVDNIRAEQVRDQLFRVRPTIEGNLDAWEYLKGLKTVFVEMERRERNIRLLDADCPENNRFHVVDEWTFSNGTPPDIRTDIMLFINGVPIIVTETKSATQVDGIAKALDDIRYYHRHGPELLAVAQLFSITHLIKFFYGATWNPSRKGLFNWRDEQAGDYETLVKTFVAPRRVLRAVSEFILFTRKDEELSKVVLRPHQMRAVEKCVERARDEDKQRGLIWHTQGSGKTYTMIVVAKRLIDDDKVFENPTVLMLVDRNELETQLFGNIMSTMVGKNLEPIKRAGYTQIGSLYIVESKKGLRHLLVKDTRGLIVTMVHKFDKSDVNLIERKNVFVLVDEAHRTTGGDLGNYLMGAIPNATYLGFTGTPIDRTAHGKGTFKVFGLNDPKGYLDKYSIRESVEDGTTVPLHYSLAPNELRVKREVLEKEFLELAELEGVSDIEELNQVLDRAVNLKNMLKNRDRIDNVAQFAAEHFRSTIEPMGYKAFLVAVDREACVLYKRALDKHLPPEYSTVVVSSGGKGDPDILREVQLSDSEEKEVRKAFRNPERLPKILIVTEKLLTGFDAPVLYCMYLDKPMRDHVLLQAIARVNRPYEDADGRAKPAGFVLDFVGIFENLEKALAFDSQDVSGVVEGIDVLKGRFAELMEQARREYLPIVKGHTGDKAVEALLEHFRDKDRRQEFYQFFRELESVYEILSPDPFLRLFIDDYSELARFYNVLRACYERGVPVDKDFLRKTALLVQQHTDTGTIQPPDKVHRLDSDTLEQIAAAEKPPTVKIFNLLKALHDIVERDARQEPYLISIGDKAEQIAQLFEARQETTQKTLEELERLLAELRQAQQRRVETELSPEAFAVYWMLQRDGVDKAQDVAQSAATAFADHPHWQSSTHQEQEVRKSLYKALITAGVDGVVEVAQRLMKMLRRAS